MLGAAVTPQVAALRLAAGLLQGLLLYCLYRASEAHAWPSTEPFLFAPLVLLGVLWPVLLISSLSHLAPRKILLWLLVSGLVIGALACHDIWREGSAYPMLGGTRRGGELPSPLLFVFSCAGLYIAQALVLAGALDRRRIARYSSYFEMAWKLAIQLLFSAVFVGALWAALWLGAALFMLIQLHFLKNVLEHSWFVIPVLCCGFSAGMHLTDVRPAIVRGIRTLLLVLLSWILPLTALMVAGFLLSLPFTGLEPLWATRHAAGVLLGTNAALVVLINAAFQNGEVSASVARLVAWSARLAALLLLPLTAIAIYALGLRVHDYGWSSDRIIAAACMLVAACYALGYAWAARSRGLWLAQVAGVNVATAFVVLGVLLALFSPLADPARLSVDDQMARFAAGKMTADKFDFNYLRAEGARYGRAALLQLSARQQGADAALIRDKASLALKQAKRGEYVDAAELQTLDVGANLTVWPKGARLPERLLRHDWRADRRVWDVPASLKLAGQKGDAYSIDVDGDGKPEIVIIDRDAAESGGHAVVLAEQAGGDWLVSGKLPNGIAQCAALRQKLMDGDLHTIARPTQDLSVGGRRIAIEPISIHDKFECDAK